MKGASRTGNRGIAQENVFKTPVAADVSRRKSYLPRIQWRELTFAATGFVEILWPGEAPKAVLWEITVHGP